MMCITGLRRMPKIQIRPKRTPQKPRVDTSGMTDYEKYHAQMENKRVNTNATDQKDLVNQEPSQNNANNSSNTNQQPNYSEQQVDDGDRPVVVNNYYAADDYDYYYASRIRRFHQPYLGFNYYSPFYTDYYWYDPFYFGSSIYWGPSFGFGIGLGFGWDPWCSGWGYGGGYYAGYGYGGYYGGGYYGGYYGCNLHFVKIKEKVKTNGLELNIVINYISIKRIQNPYK
eukprot:TRINITY_DN2542_c0_g1_i2.p1 TRINITY_DN2542_c0_g1~~TRINITY_DN2542_c0_g1_i2.p1  ORF type:complete len:227 (-),score=5.54 TRINITY_DN2542_c0_g1_i2:668-1348(-)